MPSMANKTPNRKLKRVIKANCEDRQEKVGALYCKGFTQLQIAAELDVCQQTVSTDLAKIRERWKARAEASYDQKVQEELAKIDALEAEAQAGYLRSKRGAVMYIKNEATGELEKTVGPDKPGDTKFLDKVSWCIETRLKLVGLLDQRTTVINNNTNAVADFTTLFVRKDDPQLSEKRAAVIPPVNDPLELELRRLEEQAGIERGQG